MSARSDAICSVCRNRHTATDVGSEKARVIAEDAQSLEDYYLMDQHTDASTGRCCDGSGRPPRSLLQSNEDDGDYLEDGDTDDGPEEEIYRLTPEEAAHDPNQNEYDLYGSRALD